MAVEALSSTADLEESREKLIQSFAGLTEASLDEPNVVGSWSIRECLAHIIAWDHWGEETLATLERGETPTACDEESMNRAAAEDHQQSASSELRREMRRSRLLLLSRLAAMTDEERTEPRYTLVEKTLSADDFIDGFIEHDLEHASQIRAWRKAKRI